MSTLLILAAPCLAQDEDAHWVVASVDGGGWKSSDNDPSVRTAVRSGDTIQPTDRLETFQNNQVALTRDPQGRNIVAVRGAFRIGSSEKGSLVQLERGRVLAVLDGLNGSEDFNITTLAGVAAVRGTRFIVESPFSGMSVKTFRGEVLVSAYASGNTSSRAIGRSIDVLKGQKTAFESGSKEKLAVSNLSPRDWAEYDRNLQLIRSARKSLKSSGARWFEESAQPSRARRVPSNRQDGSDSGKAGHAIVF